MKRTAIFLSEDQIARLKAIAKGRTISELIRQAIEEFLERMEKKK
jgi:predicted DNA-binding protein